jgi:membrane protein involved in D-alanine export
MIPYADFLYFGILLYILVPTLLLRLTVGVSRLWIVLATLLMLVVQYGGGLFGGSSATGMGWLGGGGHELWILLGYAVLQYATARAYLALRPMLGGRRLFWMAILLSLSPLFVAKFLPLLSPGHLLGFLGISYVTFRSLDIIFSIEDRIIVSLPPGQFFAYLFFFPTISSGPIDRYRRFADDWKRERGRASFVRDLDGAVHHVFTGFLYKFILAALIERHWLEPASRGTALVNYLSYMYAYSFYLFFDFAGYSAFAIGISYLFGVHTPENFDRPFLARNIRDFWNRWHITLSTWFRDHLYMRFVLAATKGKWFRSKYTASYLAFFLSFGLMGLWHGTEAHYLLYGLYQASLLVGFDLFTRFNKAYKIWGDGPVWRGVSTLVTFHAVCFGFLLFSGHIGPTLQASPAAVADYDGSHDSATIEEVAGWAWDSAHPDRPVEVEIFDGDTLLAKVPANQLRPDLARGKKGDGKHAFHYNLPVRIKDGRPHVIRVRIAGTNQELLNTPKTVLGAELIESVEGYEGVHDTATCERITGWALDNGNPNESINVDIYADDRLIATVRADGFRQGLKDSGMGNGKHAFNYPLPANLKDGRVHSIRVRFSGTSIDLRSTPKVIDCSP